MLRVVILGAGYGTRLQRDVSSDRTGRFSFLSGLPKPLLPLGIDITNNINNINTTATATTISSSCNCQVNLNVGDGSCTGNEKKGGKPLINVWIKLVREEGIPLEHIFIVTNDFFLPQFTHWANSYQFPLSNILSDKTESNETRLGALSDLHLAITHFQLAGHHLLVIAGDTLFLPSFSLHHFVAEYKAKLATISHHRNKNSGGGLALISYYELSDPQEVSKRGIIELDEDGSGRVTRFLEKPRPYQPNEANNTNQSTKTTTITTKSKLAVPPLYLFSSQVLDRLADFVCRDTTTRDQRDAPGLLIPYLLQKPPLPSSSSSSSSSSVAPPSSDLESDLQSTEVFGFRIEGRFDVGGLDDYIACNQFFLDAES